MTTSADTDTLAGLLNRADDLVRNLQNLSKMKYAADCKCGECAVVPLTTIAGSAEVIFDLAIALRAQAAKDKARIERLEAALRKMNVGDGWAARIARAALEDGE